MPTVRFMPDNIEITVDEQTNLIDAALEHDVNINHNCGGNCACSTCHVLIDSGQASLETPDVDELDMLEEVENLSKRSRLACQVNVTADLVVTIPTLE